MRRDIEIRADEVRVTLRSERQVIPAFGIEGGMPGALGEFILSPETNREEKLPLYVTNRRFVRGDVISIRTPGGGGCGDSRQRRRVSVEEDLRCGYVSLNMIRDVYGAKRGRKGR